MFFFQIMKDVLNPNIQSLASISCASLMKLVYQDQEARWGQLHDGGKKSLKKQES